MLLHRHEKSRFSKMRAHRRHDRCPFATNAEETEKWGKVVKFAGVKAE
jgi:hypothetical protein